MSLERVYGGRESVNQLDRFCEASELIPDQNVTCLFLEIASLVAGDCVCGSPAYANAQTQTVCQGLAHLVSDLFLKSILDQPDVDLLLVDGLPGVVHERQSIGVLRIH